MQKAVTYNANITQYKRHVGARAEKSGFFARFNRNIVHEVQDLRLTAWTTNVHELHDCKATCIILHVMHVIPHLGA